MANLCCAWSRWRYLEVPLPQFVPVQLASAYFQFEYLGTFLLWPLFATLARWPISVSSTVHAWPVWYQFILLGHFSRASLLGKYGNLQSHTKFTKMIVVRAGKLGFGNTWSRFLMPGRNDLFSFSAPIFRFLLLYVFWIVFVPGEGSEKKKEGREIQLKTCLSHLPKRKLLYNQWCCDFRSPWTCLTCPRKTTRWRQHYKDYLEQIP